MSHALVFGASGISGWALLNSLPTYPTSTTFAKITGVSNRPLTLEQAQLPADARLSLVNGIDLTKPVAEVVHVLQEKVADVQSISHVFFTAYIQTNDFESLKKVNTALLETAVRAVEQVSASLKTIILQTGGKGYGLEFPKEVGVRAPLREDFPRIPEPWAGKIFYYTQYDMLKELSQGKSWTFTEVRPDGIVGFAPTSNAMNMSQGIAIYLTIFREVHGAGTRVPFPGREHGYHSTHSDTFQDILAKMEIFAATNIEKCGGGGVFNVADGKTVSWAQVWPGLCQHFGLEAQAPVASPTPMEQFVNDNIGVWKTLAKKHGLREEVVEEQNWGHVNFMLVDFDFDRQYDLSRSRSVGFAEEIDTVDGYVRSWERMREAKILPPRPA